MKSEIEHSSTTLGSQNMKSSQRMVSVVEPYELPEGWKWCRLGDVAEIIMGQSPAGTSMTENQNDIAFIGGASDMGEELPNISRYTSEPTKLSKRDDVIVCIRATLGRPIFSDGIYCLGRGVAGIRSETLMKEYIKYGFLNFEQYLYDKATGSTFLQVSSKYLNEMPFPLPPTLAEQQRIVNRIESMFAKLDEAKEKAQNVVDGFETRKAAILHKAFTGELKIENEKLKEEDWEETTLSECCKLGSGGTPSKSYPEYYENGDIPWLKTGEIDWNDIYDAEEKITAVGVANSSAKMFPAESVVVAMYGMGVTRGRAAIIKTPMTTNQAVCVLQPKEKLYNKFLFYYFMCNYHKIREQSVGGNQLNLSGKIIGNFPIKLPPFNFQLSIVNFLDIIIEKENKAKQAAEAVLEQIDLLKKSILARAFRGEL